MVKRQQGFTLTELIITVVIIGVLAAIALPSFAKMLERNRIKEAVVGMKSDIHWARSEAIKQSCNISTAVTTGNSWQYVISSACSGAMKTVAKTADDVTISSTNFPSNTFSFLFRRGDIDNDGYINFATANYQLRVEIDDGWKIQICSPVAANAVGGYGAC